MFIPILEILLQSIITLSWKIMRLSITIVINNYIDTVTIQIIENLTIVDISRFHIKK